MKISLKLKHCIETETKKKYEYLIKQYFKKNFDSDKINIETQIEALKSFLENADFKELRSKYTELNGRNNIDILLKISKDNRNIKISFNNRDVDIAI